MALLLAASLLPSSFPAQAAAGSPAAGVWEAVLEVGTRSIRFIVRVEQGEDGGLSATLDIPERGLGDLTIDEVGLEGDRFFFDFRLDQARYRGRLAPGGDRIEGEWTQRGQTLPLTLKRIETAPPLPGRPQTPAPPYPYPVEEVSLTNEADGLRLAGTLTVPAGAAGAPAVMLLSVAGPNDRDQSFAGHKSFHLLADHLTRRGIAVLRIDDRGVGESEGDLFQSTYDDFVEDALAGVEYLRGRPEVDDGRVGLMGMSEGAGVAALAASRSDRVAFVIMLSGMGLRGAEAIAGQLEALSRLAGYSDGEIEAVLQSAREVWAVLAEEPDDARAGARIRSILEAATVRPPAAAALTPPGDRDAQVELFTSPWYRYQVAFDPAPALRRLRGPLLALSGELDPVLPPGQNLPAIHAALREGGIADLTIAQLPGLNHLLQPARTGMPLEYAQIDTTIAPLALETISGWLLARFPSGP